MPSFSIRPRRVCCPYCCCRVGCGSCGWPAGCCSGSGDRPWPGARSSRSCPLPPPRPAHGPTRRIRAGHHPAAAKAGSVWEALRGRLSEAAAAEPANNSGQLLALDGLIPRRRGDLLLGLLEQFERLRRRLLQDDPRGVAAGQLAELQPELRQQALRQMAGSYVQLPMEGRLGPWPKP